MPGLLVTLAGRVTWALSRSHEKAGASTGPDEQQRSKSGVPQNGTFISCMGTGLSKLTRTWYVPSFSEGVGKLCVLPFLFLRDGGCSLLPGYLQFQDCFWKSVAAFTN